MNKILKYQGNKKYFSALVEMKEKFFILIAFVSDDVSISQERNYGPSSIEGSVLHFWDDFSFHLDFKLDTRKDVVYQLIALDDIKEYDIMVKLLEVLYPNDTE